MQLAAGKHYGITLGRHRSAALSAAESGVTDRCRRTACLVWNLNERMEEIMGANHAGVRKRQKAKNTRKIAESIARKQAQQPSEKKSG